LQQKLGDNFVIYNEHDGYLEDDAELVENTNHSEEFHKDLYKQDVERFVLVRPSQPYQIVQ
jgi:hypothetical protein